MNETAEDGRCKQLKPAGRRRNEQVTVLHGDWSFPRSSAGAFIFS